MEGHEWKCEVIKAENGYVIRSEEESENEEEYKKIETIAIENEDEKEAFTGMALKLADYFGLHYDKYGSENLNVLFNKKGHKLD